MALINDTNRIIDSVNLSGFLGYEGGLISQSMVCEVASFRYFYLAEQIEMNRLAFLISDLYCQMTVTDSAFKSPLLE